MPKWVKLYEKTEVLAFLPEDIQRAEPHFDKAQKMWEKYYKDEGSCVLGCGISVWWIPPRCRKPQEYMAVHVPGQGDGGNSVHIPLNYLAMNGIPGFYNPGRMD
jgi:hypothetical protein